MKPTDILFDVFFYIYIGPAEYPIMSKHVARCKRNAVLQ